MSGAPTELPPSDGSSPDRRAQVDDLVVASNLGQLRNVCAWRRGRPPGASVRTLLIGTPSSRGVTTRLLAYAELADLDVSVVELPDMPGAVGPLRVRRVREQIEAIARMWSCRRVWVANIDAHYSLLVSAFVAAGARPCYYEEGLGTYRSDPHGVPRLGVRRRVASLIVAVGRDLGLGAGSSWLQVARRFRWNVRRLAATVSSEVWAAITSTAPGRRVFGWLAGRGAVRFLDPWTQFDEAVVVLPELLDGAVIDAAQCRPLDARPTVSEVAAAGKVLGLVGVEAGTSLFVSQPYLDRGAAYYGFVARTLADRGLVEVFVQPHPRERPHQLRALVGAFARAGVTARWDERTRHLPAEALLATGRFASFSGVATSTLVYGPLWFPSLEHAFLGPDVLRAAEGAAMPVGEVATLASHIALVRRVRSAIGMPAA